MSILKFHRLSQPTFDLQYYWVSIDKDFYLYFLARLSFAAINSADYDDDRNWNDFQSDLNGFYDVVADYFGDFVIDVLLVEQAANDYD